MGTNDKKITIGALGAAIVSILATAETGKNPLLDELKALGKAFDSYAASVSEEESQTLGIVEDLKNQLKAAIDTKGENTKKPVIEIDKVKYVVNHGSYPYSAAELAENKDAAKAILKIQGQNALTKL